MAEEKREDLEKQLAEIDVKAIEIRKDAGIAALVGGAIAIPFSAVAMVSGQGLLAFGAYTLAVGGPLAYGIAQSIGYACQRHKVEAQLEELEKVKE